MKRERQAAFASCLFVVVPLLVSQRIEAVAETAAPFNLYGDRAECVCDFREDVDYFPTKAESNFAETYHVTYHGHYKVVNVTETGDVYVLYQCGTPRPDSLFEDGDVAAFVEVPVARVAVTSTTFVPWIEFLGERQSIVAISNANTLSSPCLRRRVDTGDDVVDVYDSNTWGIREDLVLDADVDVVFCSAGWGCPISSNPNITSIAVTAQRENSVLAEAESVEFFSLFFNRERAAMDVVENIDARFDCLERDVADNYIADSNFVRPTVVWVNYYNGWSVGTCPGNYYCELVHAAGGEILTNPGPGSANYGYLNDTEFVSFAQDADVLLYTGQNYWTTDSYGGLPIRTGTSNKTAVLESLSSFQNNRVYDTLNNGPRDWFESRLAEPDVVLQDLINVLHQQFVLSDDLVWWRPVEPTQPPDAVIDACSDLTQPLQLHAIGTCAETNPIAGLVSRPVATTPNGSLVCDSDTGAPTLCHESCASCNGASETDCTSCTDALVIDRTGACVSFANDDSESWVHRNTVILVTVLSGIFVVSMVLLACFLVHRRRRGVDGGVKTGMGSIVLPVKHAA